MFSKLIKTTGLAVGLAMLVAGPAQAATSMSVIMDGNTFNSPFSISNNSNAGETLLSFGLDLGGAGAFCFDTVLGGPCNNSTNDAGPFTPVGNSDLTTGLLASAVVDGGTTLGLTFNDFDPLEDFIFTLDVDRPGNGSVRVLGSDLIGATAKASFSNGTTLSGVFGAIEGNPDASGFRITTIPIPAGLPLLLTALGGLGFLMRRREQE